MKKATHRGNCQVCGHQQHVMENGLALHGYTVKFGYFNGTCDGSNNAPIQIDRTMTDATIVGLHNYAARQDETAEKLQAGETHPVNVQVGKKYDTNKHKHVPIYVPFDEANPEQQKKAVELAVMECESNARHARSHATDLAALADRLHGTELVAISELELRAVKPPKAVVDIKAATVTGTFGSKAARKAELDKLNREFSDLHSKLQRLYLAMPHTQRTEANTEVYYGPSMLHQWRAKHSAAALKEFPEAVDLVAKIEELVKAREAIKAAP